MTLFNVDSFSSSAAILNYDAGSLGAKTWPINIARDARARRGKTAGGLRQKNSLKWTKIEFTTKLWSASLGGNENEETKNFFLNKI